MRKINGKERFLYDHDVNSHTKFLMKFNMGSQSDKIVIQHSECSVLMKYLEFLTCNDH